MIHAASGMVFLGVGVYVTGGIFVNWDGAEGYITKITNDGALDALDAIYNMSLMASD